MVAVTLNPQREVSVLSVGGEKTPVVIIDDVVNSPGALVHWATHHATFSEERVQGYPGVRAQLPEAYAAALMPALSQLVRDVYTALDGHELRVVQQLFSLVAQPPESLELLQRVPHFDNHSPFYFATVHYLAPGEFGGTGIFRHRPTGFESISEKRYAIFVRAAKAYMQQHGVPAPGYIDRSDAHFELIRELQYRPNRLLMYPGYLLHSGLIDPQRDISADPASGRLTANLFFMPVKLPG